MHMKFTTWIARLNLKLKMLQSHFCGYNDAETFVKKIWTVFPTLPTDWQSKQITLKIDHYSLTV